MRFIGVSKNPDIEKWLMIRFRSTRSVSIAVSLQYGLGRFAGVRSSIQPQARGQRGGEGSEKSEPKCWIVSIAVEDPLTPWKNV